jgi:hypothetical protein
VFTLTLNLFFHLSAQRYAYRCRFLALAVMLTLLGACFIFGSFILILAGFLHRSVRIYTDGVHQTKNLDEASEPLRNVNVVLAAYTTAQARLKLYEHLEALGGQVLCYDTDSKKARVGIRTRDLMCQSPRR